MTRPSLARLWPLIAAALLTGCIPRLPHPSSDRGTHGRLSRDSLRQCLARLDLATARYRLLPERRTASGCAIVDALQLRDIGTPVANLGAMTCPLASAFTSWVQSDVNIPAVGEFGSPVAKIESFGTYACRNVNNAATGRLSEHAFANAVDVSAFVLRDGRRISVLTGWHGDPREQRFLRSVRAAACRRFGTVLSPDYNALHRDHLHLDMGGGRLCR